ncbi:MAG: glycosyltransferase family 39 protein [Planctomycetota bacterium]|nr:glycosyltransferase family 39 protein [Planctomycetota bacterium]
MLHRRRHEVAALLACALAVRLLAAFVVQTWVDQTPGRLCLVEGDAEGYWALAQSVTQRGEFSLYNPPRRIERMPGFPLWLAGGMRLFGERVVLHRLGFAFIGTAACWLTYQLGRLLFEEPVGRLAGWMVAFSPPLSGISVLILSETLFAVGLMGSLVLLAVVWRRIDERPGCRDSGLIVWGMAAGAMAGMATLVRPTWLPFVPICAVGLVVWNWLVAGPNTTCHVQNNCGGSTGASPSRENVLSHREIRAGDPNSGSTHRALVAATSMIGGLILVMIPWVVRNWQVVGHPVVTTLWAGPSLYDGLNPHATGESDMRFIEEDGIYQRMSEYDADRHYRQAAIEFSRENPRRVMELGLVKLGRFWNPLPNADQFASLPIRLALAAWSGPLFVLSAIGLWIHRRDLRLWVLAVGPVVFFAAVHAVFIGSVRYRLPAEYALVPLAAYALRRLCGATATLSTTGRG